MPGRFRIVLQYQYVVKYAASLSISAWALKLKDFGNISSHPDVPSQKFLTEVTHKARLGPGQVGRPGTFRE